MSVWTHVAGIIRVDGFGINPDFDKIMGKELRWGSSDWEHAEMFPMDYMPFGSEGSLSKSIWKNPDSSSMAMYTVSVFGDLRDYEDSQAVIDWFIEVCDKLWIRQAVITVHTEGQKPLNYVYGGIKR